MSTATATRAPHNVGDPVKVLYNARGIGPRLAATIVVDVGQATSGNWYITVAAPPDAVGCGVDAQYDPSAAATYTTLPEYVTATADRPATTPHIQ